MSTDSGSESLPVSRAARAVRDLHPGYFAFVMATGIVSAAAFLLGRPWLSRGFFVVDCAGLDEALAITRELGEANPGGAYEVRPIAYYLPGASVT